MKYMITTIRISLTALLFVLCLGWTNVHAADVGKGEALFKQHCSSCHAPDRKIVGPALKGTKAKYADDPTWIYKWIKNNTALIKAGDKKAVAVYEANGKAAMTVFTFLTDPEIDDVLAYVEDYKPKVAIAAAPTSGETTNPLDDPQIYYSLLGLVGLLIGVAVMLVFAAAGLAASVRAKDESRDLSADDVWQTFKNFLSNKFVTTCIVATVVVGGTIQLISAARGVSLHQGFMPEQPIKFDHKLHAGINQVNCQYCHSGASKSKNAWIPSTNVCMNCHKAIEEGPTYGKGEISKIYMSAKWNPIADKYFADNTPIDTVAAVFKKWLADEAGIKYPKKIKNVESAYAAAKAIGFNKAVEWIRIHNLPDHAYFNHAQHIAVGGNDKDGKVIECQTCHGPIQEMEVVYQHAPLSMGWCINCHRESKTTYSFPDPKDAKKSMTPTPEQMGGLDCAKCHY